MAVFISTTYYGDNSKVEDALKQLDSLNIKNIEIGSNHVHATIDKLDFKRNTNYIIHNYFPAKKRDFVLNLASENDQVREKTIAFYKNTIKLCQKLSVKYYTIHPGYFAEASLAGNNKLSERNFDFEFQKVTKNREKVLSRTIKIIKDLYFFAAESKIQLLIENQGSKTSKSFTIFDSIKELDFLKNEVGEALKFNFNLAHATLAGFNLLNGPIFRHFYENSLFFEVSEIKGEFDAHLPVYPQKGIVGKILSLYKSKFKQKNVILEYRNIKKEKLQKSFDFINKIIS